MYFFPLNKDIICLDYALVAYAFMFCDNKHVIFLVYPMPFALRTGKDQRTNLYIEFFDIIMTELLFQIDKSSF